MSLLDLFDSVEDVRESLPLTTPEIAPEGADMGVVREDCRGIIGAEVFIANLDSHDLADIKSGAIPTETLRAFAQAMAERLTRERGEIPASYDQYHNMQALRRGADI